MRQIIIKDTKEVIGEIHDSPGAEVHVEISSNLDKKVITQEVPYQEKKEE